MDISLKQFIIEYPEGTVWCQRLFYWDNQSDLSRGVASGNVDLSYGDIRLKVDS
jgi:hypothetical protein